MPDAPDLSRVPDDALNRFLAVALFGYDAGSLHRGAVSNHLLGHRAGDDLAARTGIYRVVPDTSTADGTEAVLDAMSALGWWGLVKTPFLPGEPSWAGFGRHGQTGWNGQPDHIAPATSRPRAVAEAAALALYPTASPEARALLAVPSDA